MIPAWVKATHELTAPFREPSFVCETVSHDSFLSGEKHHRRGNGRLTLNLKVLAFATYYRYTPTRLRHTLITIIEIHRSSIGFRSACLDEKSRYRALPHKRRREAYRSARGASPQQGPREQYLASRGRRVQQVHEAIKPDVGSGETGQ